MAMKLKLIPDIAPREVGWTCKVVVVEKTTSRTLQKGNGTYQHLWLMDTAATIFAQNIKAVENTLVPSKTYLISNAYVKSTDHRFRTTYGHTQWTISGSTRIEESNKDYSPLVESCFQFTCIQKQFQARCNVHIIDDTGSISASLFGELAEKFLHIPADTLMKDCITSENVINSGDLNNASEDHFIYIKYATLDSKMNQSTFDVVYILDSNCGHPKGTPVMSPHEPVMKNLSCHNNVPTRRNLVFEKESIKQLKKHKMIQTTSEVLRDTSGGDVVDTTKK